MLHTVFLPFSFFLDFSILIRDEKGQGPKMGFGKCGEVAFSNMCVARHGISLGGAGVRHAPCKKKQYLT